MADNREPGYKKALPTKDSLFGFKCKIQSDEYTSPLALIFAFSLSAKF